MTNATFEFEDLKLVDRINYSILKMYFYSLIVCLFIALFVYITDDSLLGTSIIPICLFGTLTLLRIGALKNYIIKIDIHDGKIKIVYSSGFFNRNERTIEMKERSFKIKYYRNPKYFPVFLIEQINPYKVIYHQYCFGHWKNKDAFEILRNYAISIEYFDFIHSKSSPKD